MFYSPKCSLHNLFSSAIAFHVQQMVDILVRSNHSSLEKMRYSTSLGSLYMVSSQANDVGEEEIVRKSGD